MAAIEQRYWDVVAEMDKDEKLVTEVVMDLFRKEDLKGIADLMERTKLAKEFMQDMEQFVTKWDGRLTDPTAQRE